MAAAKKTTFIQPFTVEIDLEAAEMLQPKNHIVRKASDMRGYYADEAERRIRRASSFLAVRDGSGRVVDFHALRHTFITRLARSGITPAVAKSLARHSTIVLTMDHYTHVLIEDERAALDRLPTINAPRANVAALGATGA